ncbi:MAG TPA: glycosyl hydrolase family 28-related protein, partial [Candidatus Acidoferrales bacterium]|nr:glycosyl hydrolase family 28-related protein [Candidatus Acidoferrales bacterium]
MRTISTLVVCVCLFAVATFGQGSQRQSVAVSVQGIPIPGASVWACQAGSTPNYNATPPCTLTNIYSDPSLGAQFLVTQPVVADGLGNYTYYAPAGTYVEVITGSNTTGYTSKIVLACAPNSTATGCSGAAGNPAGADTQVQINNHGTFGSAAGFGLDSSTTPAVLTVPFSESIKGPLPRVDVTAYGADPTGATDSTVAVTNAAAAACSAGSTLSFPPGTYILTQPQLPSNLPVIPIPCGHIDIAGSGDHGTAQSEEPPQAKISVTNIGSSPNAAPVFGFKFPTNTGNINIQDLQIGGYNQALSLYATPTVSLENVCATAQSTGLADNVPLKVTNVSGFRMTGGCLDSGSASLPMALFTGETPLGSEASVSDYVQIEHVRGSGGNFQYIQRADANGATPGNFIFDDVTPIASDTDFLTVTNATGDLGQTAMPDFGPVFVLN